MTPTRADVTGPIRRSPAFFAVVSLALIIGAGFAWLRADQARALQLIEEQHRKTLALLEIREAARERVPVFVPGPLAPAAAAPVPEGPAPTAPPEPPSARVEAEAAPKRAAVPLPPAAATLIERATASGRWDDRHRAELRALLPQVSSAEHDAIVLRLMRSFNEGELKLEGRGPLF
jgi:hypothetical protein